MSADLKQVIVMRKDLNMRKGKMIAQGSHASLAVVLQEMNNGQSFLSKPPEFNADGEYGLVLNEQTDLVKWILSAFTKICLSVNSNEELLEVYNAAKAANLPSTLITDNGQTEFNGIPTNTCIAIGPASREEIDKVCGHLKLL